LRQQADDRCDARQQADHHHQRDDDRCVLRLSAARADHQFAISCADFGHDRLLRPDSSVLMSASCVPVLTRRTCLDVADQPVSKDSPTPLM
jgi:hypothetical protein